MITFVIYYDDISASLTNTDAPYNFTIPTDMSTDSNSLYYCVKKQYNYSTTNYDASLILCMVMFRKTVKMETVLMISIMEMLF